LVSFRLFSLEMQNAALPPGKTAFLFLSYRDPHSRNSGKLYKHITNTGIIPRILGSESGVMPIFV
jgi:hypothetical protein